MGFKIKNSLTGEFEKLPILTLKGEKGETGGVEEYNKVDYMGNKYETLKQANDANVEYAVKTAIGEFNYLDYDGQHITATDTIEGRSKSAILKGQTLKNINDYSIITSSNVTIDNDGVITINAQSKYTEVFIKPLENKTSTKYLVKIKVIENTLSGDFNLNAPVDGNVIFNNAFKIIKSGYVGEETIIYTTASDLTNAQFTFRSYLSGSVASGSIKYQLSVIEYQEGMENWDIPYFEGIASVKAPVLHSVGKNLLDITKAERRGSTKCSLINNGDGSITLVGDGDGSGEGILTTSCYAYLEEGKTYTFSFESDGEYSKINGTDTVEAFLLKDGSASEHIYHMTGFIRTFTCDRTGDYYVRFDINKNNTTHKFWNIQLTEGAAIYPFEPYKSNTLSTPEDLELRGIGDVKDTLDCLTGEVVNNFSTYRFSDTDKWDTNTETNCQRFTLSVSQPPIGAKYSNALCIISDRLCGVKWGGSWNTVNTISCSDNVIAVHLPLGSTIEQCKELMRNSTAIYRTTESIKTVALSDHHVYSYKDVTHYDCSSAEGSLVPTLSVKVPTDVQATIAQQRETIQTLNSENERLNQIQEALKASMLDSQVQLMNISWNTDFEVFTLRESIAPKDFLLDSRTGSNIDKFSQAKFIIENDCPDLEKLNSQIEYYFSKDVFSQEQFEELTDLISIVKGENSCEY